MPAPDFSTASLAIAHRPDLGQLVGRWQRSVSEDELHTGYAALRQAALHHQCGRWLIDSRRRTNRSLNGPEWVLTEFLPQVQQALGLPLAVCFLVLPSYLATLAAAPVPVAGLRYARFTDEGAAYAWLVGE